MKLKGTLRKSDLEGGQWTLVSDSGEQYQLSGALADAKDGESVELEGKVDKNTMSFGMMGTQFTVQKIITH